MKKIFLFVTVACLAMATMTSCEKDYAESSTAHVYTAEENPPLKGSDTGMASFSVKMKQVEAGTEVKTIDLTQVSDTMYYYFGYTLDNAIAGLATGEFKFALVNYNARVWNNKTATTGAATWKVNANGVATEVDSLAAAVVEFKPESKQLNVTLTKYAQTGIIPITFGFVSTYDTSYSINYRMQALVNVVDATVAEVDVTVPKGGYAVKLLPFSELAKNIEAAFGETDIKNFAKDLDTNGGNAYDVYMMDSKGNLDNNGGTYTANGAGYWLKEDASITTWGTTGYAMFIEPSLVDSDGNYTSDAGFNIGRLSDTAPASGKTLPINIVVTHKKTGKTMTVYINATFE